MLQMLMVMDLKINLHIHLTEYLYHMQLLSKTIDTISEKDNQMCNLYILKYYVISGVFFGLVVGF